MFGFGSEAASLASELFGECLEGKGLEKSIRDCNLDSSNATKLISLIELMRDEYCENLHSLYIVLRLCIRFLDAQLIDQSFAFALMEIKFNAKTDINGNDGLFLFLLDEGLNLKSSCSWKYLALLLRIIHGVPGSKKVVIEIIKKYFNSRIGFTLDHLKDFQLGNHIIELLVNCFPRIHEKKPGVVMSPILWPEEPAKNEIFFGSLDYPFRGKNSYIQVINFVWQNYGTQLENALRVNNISYSTNSSGSSNGIKKFKSGRYARGKGYCYVQAVHDCMYLSDGEELFLELDRRYLDVVKTLKGCIRINLSDTKGVRCPDEEMSKVFQKTKWFQLQSEDKNTYEQFYAKVTNFRKISEAQTFLLLDQVDGNGQELTFSNRDISYRAQSSNSQPATPDHSDPKIRTDEWDINISSKLQGTKKKQRQGMTPENTNENNISLAAEYKEHEEQSPLVLVQKKRMIRETSRTLELLKKEFAQKDDMQSPTVEETGNCQKGAVERSPSLVITKFENKHRNNDKIIEMLPNTKTTRSHTPPLTSADKNIKSIGKKDISVLDTIFGAPKLQSSKKGKRQREPNNFKHVVDKPSHDIPKVQTRRIKQKGHPPVWTKENSIPPRIQNNRPDDSKLELNKKRQIPLTASHSSKKAKHSEGIARESVPQIHERTAELGAGRAKFAPIQEATPIAMNTSLNINNMDKDQPNLESSTVVPPSNDRTGLVFNGAFTDKLQEQIYSSITLFSNELLRKMTIINKELNNRIIKELSEKYQTLFQELQRSFHTDTEEMSYFISEIKDMLNLPEDELVQLIRTRKFGC